MWSDKVSVVYNMMYSSNTKLHIWNGPETTDTDKPYVFYRSQEDPRYVICSVKMCKKAGKSFSPFRKAELELHYLAGT